jgi:CTP:phosphocholine cytidylyltransferase-like protein/thiamine kinase-like enzyme
MLSKLQFDILYFLLKKNFSSSPSQRELSETFSVSLGKINSCLKELKSSDLINSELCITENGKQALLPYKVQNAVIMAAGMSSRFAPLSYEKPKALLKVHGEILIERQIRQLQEAGINDITLVVGYMKEKMFYLADKFHLNLVVNEDYYRYNNPSSLMRVVDKLKNTYICSSDDYFTENVFKPYVYQAYYAAVYSPSKTDEYCMKANQKGKIISVSIGGQNAWYMTGHVYFDQEFSRNFIRLLQQDYENPETKTQLWENFYMRHLNELALYLKPYPAGVIYEFDSLSELQKFDQSYVENVDSDIFQNIQKILSCNAKDIQQIEPIKAGMTNTSFSFLCAGKKYVYRHPGVGTDAYINRKGEAWAMHVAKELKLDPSFLYMDEKKGWKLSSFINGAKAMDYHNPSQVERSLEMVRTLHAYPKKSPYSFDIWKMIHSFTSQIEQKGRDHFEDYQTLYKRTKELYVLAEADGVPKCLCHCDCYDQNFLADENGNLFLIDWEYAGTADPAWDLGTYLACSDYSLGQAEKILSIYLQHEPNKKELCHYFAYTSISAYYWFLWAIYQESMGKSVGEYLYIWYRYTKEYGNIAWNLYHSDRNGDETNETAN